MLIYLLRHGLTAYNAEKRYQGQRDIPLCPAGRAQLRQADLRPETVYITPLCRTRQTAEVLFPGARLVEVKDLQEMCFGSFEGRNFIEMEHCPMRIITTGAPPTRAATFWMQEIGRSSGCCTC